MIGFPEAALGNRPAEFISAEAIRERVAELAREIAATIPGPDLHLLVVLRGAFIFAADLARALSRAGFEPTFDFCRVISYREGIEPGPPEVQGLRIEGLVGRDVLIVEDILDTGGSLRALTAAIPPDAPRSLRTVALLEKPSRRRDPVEADFVGFVIPDRFVVGYGLDFAEGSRHLPYVGVIEES